MDKIEAITLLYLSKQDLSHLSSLSDYIEKFSEAEKQVKSALEKGGPKWGIGNIKI